ncbi:MAG TPA: tandem-95 repeat protein, partial [Desulfobulbus sp.]|nr:tandem-95 repeat protein [Desulfobulbus sp.]
TLQVNDGAVDVDQTFTITVANVNDAPTITSTPNTAATEDTFYTYTFSTNDADSGDTHTLSAPTLPSWLSFDTNTGLLTGTPTNADVGNHTVTLRVNDGSVDVDQTFTITVANVNDAPTITSSPSTAATEDTPYTYTFSVNDVDSGDTLTLSAPTLPSWLSFDTNTGLLTGTPTNAEVGDHTVILRVNDGSVDVGQTFTITVANVNDAPTTSPITLPAIAEDSGGQTISQNELLAHSADVDGDQLTAIDLTISNGAGALSNNGDGTWNYTPAVNDDTAVDFSYTITDGNDAASGSATLDITPVNDIPVAVADNGSTSFNTTVTTGNVLANDDPGDGLVGITGFDAASTHDGTVISNNDGTFTYTPATGFNGTDTFSYTIADADGETSTAIVTMTVASPPDNHPVIGETDGPEQDAAKPGPGATVDETGNDSPPANNEAPVTAETEQKLIVAVDENIPDTAGSDPGTKTRQSPAKNTSSSDETTKTAPVAASEKSHLSRSAAQDAAVLPAGGITVHATPEAPTTIEAADSRVVPARPATQHRQTTGSSTSMLLQQYLDKVRFEGEMQYTRAFEQLQTALNDFRKEAASESQYYKTVVGSAIAVSTGLSVGYVVWLIRGGMLMSSVLFSMPAWQLADPLPLLNRADDDDDEKDDESLEKIIENGSPGKPNQMKETKKSKEAGTAL